MRRSPPAWLARKYLLAPDYPEVAREVVRAMHEQVGERVVDEQGLALRGVLVRQLVMPDLTGEAGRRISAGRPLPSGTGMNGGLHLDC